MKIYKLIGPLLVVSTSLARYINNESIEPVSQKFKDKIYQRSIPLIDLEKREEAKPKVSVIIPAYNSEKLIGRCIESALNQTLKDIEVIVIDDSSKDSTKSIIEGYAKKDSRVIGLYSRKNRGAGYSRNKGLKKAKSDFISFIDSDDYVDPGWYEYLYQNSIDKDIVYGIRVIHDFQESFRISTERPYGCIIPSIIRKSFLTKNHIKFPESKKIGEDSFFKKKINKRKPRVLYLPDNRIYYHYVKREGSLSHYVNNVTVTENN